MLTTFSVVPTHCRVPARYVRISFLRGEFSQFREILTTASVNATCPETPRHHFNQLSETSQREFVSDLRTGLIITPNFLRVYDVTEIEVLLVHMGLDYQEYLLFLDMLRNGSPIITRLK